MRLLSLAILFFINSFGSLAVAQSSEPDQDNDKVQNWLDTPEDQLLLTADDRTFLQRLLGRKKPKEPIADNGVTSIKEDDLKKVRALANLDKLSVLDIQNALYAYKLLSFIQVTQVYDEATLNAVNIAQESTEVLSTTKNGWLTGKQAATLICKAATKSVGTRQEKFAVLASRLRLSEMYRDGIGFSQNYYKAKYLAVSSADIAAELVEPDFSAPSEGNLDEFELAALGIWNSKARLAERYFSENGPPEGESENQAEITDESFECIGPILTATIEPEFRLIEASYENLYIQVLQSNTRERNNTRKDRNNR